MPNPADILKCQTEAEMKTANPAQLNTDVRSGKYHHQLSLLCLYDIIRYHIGDKIADIKQAVRNRRSK